MTQMELIIRPAGADFSAFPLQNSGAPHTNKVLYACLVFLVGLFLPLPALASVTINLTTTLDGFVQRYVEPPEAWEQIRLGDGNGAHAGIQSQCGVLAQEFGWRALVRCIYKFDTSVIPDDAQIISATLHLYVESHVNGVGALETNEDLDIVHATTAEDSTLYSSDYLHTNFGTTILGALDYDGTVDGVYNSITLDPAAISKTGVTTLGARVHADTVDAEPAGVELFANNDLRYTIKSAEAGSEFAPYLTLEVLHDAPAPPTDLQVESQTNPSDVANEMPAFSAQYENASSTATAVAYELQVSITPAWDELYWDSGKTTLDFPLVTGARTPEITSGVAFPLDGATYYWRARFWDQVDHEGEWSTENASFTMKSPVPPPPATSTIAVENFNDYTIGDLNGQGGWIGSSVFDVQGTVVSEGARAMLADHHGSRAVFDITRALNFGDGSKDTVWSFNFNYDRKGSNKVTGGSLRNPKNSLYKISVSRSAVDIFGFTVDEAGVLYFGDSTSQEELAPLGLAEQTWHYVEMERRATDGATRARWNGNVWSNWITPQSSYDTFDAVHINYTDRSAGKFRLDDIQVLQYN